MKTIEPWKPIALAIVFVFIAIGVNRFMTGRPTSAVTLSPTIVPFSPPGATPPSKAELTAKYLNAPAPGNRPLIAILAVTDLNQFDHTLMAALAPHFQTTTNDVSTSLFKPAFVTEGFFNSMFDGSSEAFGHFELSKSVKWFVLARTSATFANNPSLENVITATIETRIVILAADGSVENQSWTFRAVGPGFSQGEARSLAEERLIKQLQIFHPTL